MRVLAALLASLLLASAAQAVEPGGGFERWTRPQAPEIKNIARWLRVHGAQGYVGGDVVRTMGIGRFEGEETLEAWQRGFRTGGALRVAQASADARHDFLLFMVQRPDDQVYFYFSTVREGLKKAVVSIPSRNLVLPLDRLEAEASFRRELRYWGERIESR